jgi:hypothetical protein
MSTQQSTTPTPELHHCSCGENFDTTEELLAHAREVHRFSPL